MKTLDVGIYCVDVSKNAVFNKNHRCPACDGQATFELTTLRHWMAGDYAEGMQSTCEDCGKQWFEPLHRKAA